VGRCGLGWGASVYNIYIYMRPILARTIYIYIIYIYMVGARMGRIFFACQLPCE
jgi:hypothetical protein